MKIEVSKPRTSRKSRASGTDVTTEIEIGPLNRYDGIEPFYVVQGWGNFQERRAAKATEKAWRVYEVHTKVLCGKDLTKQEAIGLAKSLAEKLAKELTNNV